MKVYTNEALVRRKRRIGGIASLLGFGILLLSIVVSLRPQYTLYAWLSAAVGLGISLVGTYHVNRWVRPPVAEKILESVLKRLDRRYFLYNYFGPVPHLLLTPYGLVAIIAKRYEGEVTCTNDDWKGSFSIRRMYTRGLTAESLGNPTKEAEEAITTVRDWLSRTVSESADEIPVAAVILFLNEEKVELELEQKGCTAIVAFPSDLRKVLHKSVLSDLRQLRTQEYKSLRQRLNAMAQVDDDDG